MKIKSPVIFSSETPVISDYGFSCIHFQLKKKKCYLQFNQQATEHTCNILTLYITQWQVLWYMCLDQPFPFVTNRLPGFTSYFHPDFFFFVLFFFLYDLLNMDITLKRKKNTFGVFMLNSKY